MAVLVLKRWVSLLLSMASFIYKAPIASAQTTFECQVGEVPLEIRTSHNPTEGFRDINIYVHGPRFKAPGQTDEELENESFNYFSTLLHSVYGRKVSMCVPDDQCLTAIVHALALFDDPEIEDLYRFLPDEVSIIYNDTFISDKKGPFPYSGDGVQIVAELGSCEIVCDSDETLLELEAATVDINGYDWQVFDYATEEVAYACPEGNSRHCYWTGGQYYHERLCLPNSGCFALLAGERYEKYPQVEDHPSVLNVTLNGILLESLDTIQVEAIALSSEDTTNSVNCPSWSCDGNEDGAEDSDEFQMLEMFLFRNPKEPDITWSLSTVDGEGVPNEGDLGMRVIHYGVRELYYHRECVPKRNSCIRFELTVPPKYTDGGEFGNLYYEHDDYRLVLDGIVYGEGEYIFGGYGEYRSVYENVGQFEHSQYMGDCTASQICSSSSEALLQVDLVTGLQSPTWNPPHVFWSLYNDHDDRLDYRKGFVYPNESYRYFSCVDSSYMEDDDSCTEVFVDGRALDNGNIAEYSVSVDNVTFSERRECDLCVDYFLGTPIGGGDCDSSLSQAAIIGLSVGGAVLAVFCVAVAVYYISRRSKENRSNEARVSPTEHDIASPLASRETEEPTSEMPRGDQERPLDDASGRGESGTDIRPRIQHDADHDEEKT